MSVEITSADVSMSGYKTFDELNKGIFEAAKNIPEGFCDISANVYVTYPCEDDEYDYNLRNLISINTSTIEEAISELQKISAGNYTRVTLDVTLEKNCSDPKEYHTCIYSNGLRRPYGNSHSNNM